jgi:Transmembrane domain of unknown function (DUF3566)
MSDRTQGSVRTATEGVDSAPGDQPATSATQAIPTTGSQRTTGGTASGTPAGASAPPAGASSTSGSTSASAAPSAPGPVAADTTAAARAAAATKARSRGTTKAGGRGPRRARLQLRHIDTWSAFKISFVLSVALFFIWMVAVGVLYGVLSGLGVFDTLNELFGQLSSSSGGDVITPGVVFGAAAVIGAVNIILLTALGTVSTFVYNLCSDLVGGLELTLSERD